MNEKQVAFHIVGDAFVDLFAFLDGDWPEKGGDAILNQPIQTFAGGSSTNTATHLNALLRYFTEGHSKLVLHTTLNPDDQYGNILLSQAEKHGFRLVNCRKADDSAATGHCVAIVAGHERSFMTFRGCVDNFQASQLDVDQIIRSACHVHVHIAGFFNLTGFQHGLIAAQLKRIREERKEMFPNWATIVSLVPQHDATNEWDGGIDELASCLDVLIMNELEAKYIMTKGRLRMQTTNKALLSASQVDLVQDCATYFGGICPRTCIVLTKGPSGAVALLNGKIVASQSTVEVKPVDTTGAGDSFAAGFLHGLWAWNRQSHENGLCSDKFVWPTSAIQHALLWGCALGASAVLVRGASIPSAKEEVLKCYSGIEKLNND